MPAAIPKKFHFVWVGGPILPKYVPTLIYMSELAFHSGFEIYLWVDNENNLFKSKYFYGSKKNDNLGKHSCEVKKDHAIETKVVLAEIEQIRIPHLKLRNIQELKYRMRTDAFYQTDNRLQLFDSFLNRELIGLRNLAAASDLLRYEILRQEGGYYFDTDTKFKFDPKSIFVPLEPKHGFLYWQTDRQEIRNDVIAALPNNIFLEDIIKECLKRCQELEGSSSKELFRYNFEYQNKMKKYSISLMDIKRKPLSKEKMSRFSNYYENKLSLTLNTTGPGVLFDSVDNREPTDLRYVTFPGVKVELRSGIFIDKNNLFYLDDLNSDVSWLPSTQKKQYAFDDLVLNSKGLDTSKVEKKSVAGRGIKRVLLENEENNKRIKLQLPSELKTPVSGEKTSSTVSSNSLQKLSSASSTDSKEVVSKKESSGIVSKCTTFPSLAMSLLSGTKNLFFSLIPCSLRVTKTYALKDVRLSAPLGLPLKEIPKKKK